MTLEPIVFVLQLPGTMCSDNLLLKALENQAFIMMILLFLCGIKMFLGISTILYLFYPNIKGFLRRTKDKLNADDEMSVCNYKVNEDQKLSNLERQVPVLSLVDETKSQDVNYHQTRRESKIDTIFGLHATMQ